MNSHLTSPRTGVHEMPHGSRRVLGVVMLAAALGGLAGCGGSASSPAATASTGAGVPASGSTTNPGSSAPATSAATNSHLIADGCALITEAEATSALGGDPGPGTPRSQTQGSVTARVCNYSSGGSVLTVDAETPTSRAQFDSGRAKLQAAVHGQAVQDLAGVGDAAYMSITGSGGACIVLKGSVAVNILLLGHTPGASPAATVTTLCKAAAGRL